MTTPKRTTLRLVLRQHRFPLVVMGIAAVVLALDWAFVAWLQFGVPPICRQAPTSGRVFTDEEVQAAVKTCDELLGWIATGTNFVLLSANFLPIFAVLIAAAPLVASEVEFGTATLAWTLARSRRAWLLPRLAFLLVGVLVIAVLAGLVTDALTAELYLTGSPWESLYAYTGRGALIASRVMLSAAAAVFAGALLGRQMPGLLLGGVLTLGLALGLTIWDDQTNRANAVPMPPGTPANLVFESKVRVVATGEYLEWWALPAEDQDPSAPGWNDKYIMVDFGIPDSQAGAVVGRNVVGHAIPTLLFLGLTFVVVERRRPYLS